MSFYSIDDPNEDEQYSDSAFQPVVDLDDLQSESDGRNNSQGQTYHFPISKFPPPIAGSSFVKSLYIDEKVKTDLYLKETKSSQKTFFVVRELDCNATEEEVEDLFRSPLEDMAGSDSPNFDITKCRITIMRIIDAGIPPIDSNHGPWIAFEFVPGGTLYQSIKFGRQFNTVDRFKIIYGIAQTLGILHNSGKFNRDIRLESIVASPESCPVFCDFAMIYKYREKYPTIDTAFQVYLSPVFSADNNLSKKDRMSNDIYSFGMLTYMFVGKTLKPLSKDKLDNYDKYLAAFHRQLSETQDLERCFNDFFEMMEMKFHANDETENDLLEIAQGCLYGRIESAEDILKRLNLKMETRYFKNEIFSFAKDVDNEQTLKDDMYKRGRYSEIVKSAEKLNAPDVGLLLELDILERGKAPPQKKKDVSVLAAEACLYAALTQDYTFYEKILCGKDDSYFRRSEEPK